MPGISQCFSFGQNVQQPGECCYAMSKSGKLTGVNMKHWVGMHHPVIPGGWDGFVPEVLRKAGGSCYLLDNAVA